MKQIVSILFVGLLAAGCASPRYAISSITSQPRESGQSMDFVAMKIDQKTGQAWWCQNTYRGENSEIQWFPILDAKK
jgi:uncharacterized protein YceK